MRDDSGKSSGSEEANKGIQELDETLYWLELLMDAKMVSLLDFNPSNKRQMN